jgi:hypothetical protein
MLPEAKFERHKLLWLIALWSAFGLFFGIQNYVRDIYFGQRASLLGYSELALLRVFVGDLDHTYGTVYPPLSA